MQQVANSHKQQSQALIVGYTMKPSRERTLAARGMLPLAPKHNVCFVPVDFAHPLEEQGPFDVILHKVGCICVFHLGITSVHCCDSDEPILQGRGMDA